MSNPSLYSKFPNILFIPSIKLTKELLDTNLGEDDIKKIFLSPNQFDNFIMRIKSEGLYKPITINDAKTKGIIYNNIKFILNIFFKKGNNLFVNNSQYIINDYEWNNKYNLTPVTGQKAPIVDIKLNFFLHKGKEMSFIESTRLNCMRNKESIINDYYKLVGLNTPPPATGATGPQSATGPQGVTVTGSQSATVTGHQGKLGASV